VADAKQLGAFPPWMPLLGDRPPAVSR
jgi:hypothetical protein